MGMSFEKSVTSLKQSIGFTAGYLEYCINELICAKMMEAVGNMIEENYVAPKSYEYQDNYEDEDYEKDLELEKEFNKFEEKTQIVTDIIDVASNTVNEFANEIKRTVESVKTDIEEYVSKLFSENKKEDIEGIRDFVQELMKHHSGYGDYPIVGKLDVGKLLELLNDEEFLKVCRLKDDKQESDE